MTALRRALTRAAGIVAISASRWWRRSRRASGASTRAVSSGAPLTAQQRTVLQGIAADTWRFYAADVDPTTHLPLDNIGPGSVRGTYTSAANVGVYLWAVVAAHDLNLISRRQADYAGVGHAR